MNDRRNEKLKPNQCFHVITPEGKRFHVYTNEGLEAKLKSGSVPVDSIIQLSRSTNNSDPFPSKEVKKIPYHDGVKMGFRYEFK